MTRQFTGTCIVMNVQQLNQLQATPTSTEGFYVEVSSPYKRIRKIIVLYIFVFMLWAANRKKTDSAPNGGSHYLNSDWS
jgi:hypothetical protein